MYQVTRFGRLVYMMLTLVLLCVFEPSETSAKYVVELHKGAPTASSEKVHTVMKTRSGEEYECFLPNINKKKKKHVPIMTKYQFLLQAQERLEPLTFSKCLQKSVDYWVYEFCFGKGTKQFHEENGKISTEFSLGSYSGLKTDTYERPTEDNFNGAKYIQSYSMKGTDGRSSTARYTCGSTDKIVSVSEVTSHQYIFVIQTPLICGLSDSMESLLSPIHTDDRCLKASKSWWTFELCPGNFVRQYHAEEWKSKNAVDAAESASMPSTENDSRTTTKKKIIKYSKKDAPVSPPPGDGTYLGYFDVKSNKLFSQQQELDLQRYVTSDSPNKKGFGIGLNLETSQRYKQFGPVFIEYYTNGTICEITGNPRRAQVRYTCEPGTKEIENDEIVNILKKNPVEKTKKTKPNATIDTDSSIVSIDEVSSCEYIINVTTPLVCPHPAWKVSNESSVEKLHKINCYQGNA